MNRKKFFVIPASMLFLFLLMFIGFRPLTPENNTNLLSLKGSFIQSSSLSGTAASLALKNAVPGKAGFIAAVQSGSGAKAPIVQTASTLPFKVYLSPSCQTWNPYSDGSGSEEYHMRQIASAMPAYLQQYGIQSVLAAPQTGNYANQKKTITARVKQAADTNCNLYLAIHSNARDGGPKINGTTIFYPSTSEQSLRFAHILTSNFAYPNKNDIDFTTQDELWEMYMPKMPHCLIETAYHDNPEDIQWIEANTQKIAQNLAYCIALYANPAATANFT
jgi:hypothetical protein